MTNLFPSIKMRILKRWGVGAGLLNELIFTCIIKYICSRPLSLSPLSLSFVTDDYMYLFNLSLPSYFQEIFQVQYKKPDGTSLTQTKVTDFVSLLFLKLWILECWSISYYLDIYPTIIPKIYLILIVDIEIIFLKE